MMAKGEIAAYLGMANVMMTEAFNEVGDNESMAIMKNVRQALLEAQIYMTQEALREVMMQNDKLGSETP